MPLRLRDTLLLIMALCGNIYAETAIGSGVLDLRGGFAGVIPLQGEWAFYPREFIAPETPFAPREFIMVPGSWGARRTDLMPTHQGFATYRLQILLPANLRGQHFGLLLPQISTAYRLYANGRLVAEVGRLSADEADFKPEYKRQIIYLAFEEKILLTFHVANYAEALVGGLWKTPEFAEINTMFAARNRALGHDLLLLGAALIFAVYHLALFIMRRSDYSPLAFALFCLIVALRTASTGERVLAEYFSLPWVWQLRLEYASIYFALPAFAWFVHTVYPLEFKRNGMYFFLAISAPFIFQVLFTEPMIFARYLRLAHAIILLGILWILYGMALALVRRRLGAKSYALGTMALIVTAIHDIIAYNSFYGVYILPWGLLVFLFGQSSILAIRFAHAFRKEQEALARTREINRSINRFVPEHALQLLGHSEVTEIAAGQQRELDMAVLFADIRNFTAISEKMTSQETFNFLNAYLNRVGPAIRENNGYIDKYMGDGIMALFPFSANDAIQAVLRLIRELDQYNALRGSVGYPPIRVGMGLSFGRVAIGTLGEAERIDVTVVSDTVNLAARLQELCRRLGASVLLSERFFQQIHVLGEDDYRLVGQVRVKGKQELVTVFEVISARSAAECEELRLTKGIFERGIHSYWQKEYVRAIELFQKCLSMAPDDRVAQLYLKLCEAYRSNPESLIAQDTEYSLV
ncbi:MAG: adenylate/guanylate cyclase domain-containing protein [Turneriella sp.]